MKSTSTLTRKAMPKIDLDVRADVPCSCGGSVSRHVKGCEHGNDTRDEEKES